MNEKLINFVVNIPSSISNKGDEAIAKCMLESIKKKYPNSKISIICSDPQYERNFFKKFTPEIHGRLFSIKGRKRNFLLSFEFFLKTLWYIIWTKLKFLPLNKNAKTILNLFEKSELIIFGGGGYLGGSYSSIQDILIPIFLAKKLHKKVYLSSITIEPPKHLLRKKLIKFVLNQVDLITTREPISYEVLNSLNIQSPKYITSDYAMLLKNEPKQIGLDFLIKSGIPNRESKKIGISLKHWDVKNIDIKYLEVELDRIESYREIMKESIEKLLRITDSIIILFPFDSSSISDDRVLCNLMKKRVDKTLSERIFIIEEEYNSEQIKSMIGNMDILIGTRLHSTIFSLSMYVPTISIGYMQKNVGFMESLDLKEWILDFSTFTSHDLVELSLKLMNNPEKMIIKLKNKIPELQKKAFQNVELIKDLLK